MNGPTGIEIADFVAARLIEDIALARAVGGHQLFDGTGIIVMHTHLEIHTRSVTLPSHVAAYASHYDPARALAESEAKGRRLDLLVVAWNRLQDVQHDPDVGPIEHGDAIGRFGMALRMVALDASVWADHPDYKPAWAEPDWRPGS